MEGVFWFPLSYLLHTHTQTDIQRHTQTHEETYGVTAYPLWWSSPEFPSSFPLSPFPFPNPSYVRTGEDTLLGNACAPGSKAATMPQLSFTPQSRSHRGPPVLLSWEDVEYRVPVGTGGDRWEKTVLRGISGYVGSGDMLAILGPSGAGKTTLLDVLAQRKSTGRVQGRILLNGQPVTSDALRRVSGYVQQEDVMHSYITVEETIRFSATLRTPPSVAEEEIEARVDRVIQLLGISHVRHCKIGSAFVRGISGGERKRCAVAMELVTAPSLLFLDEPTTGIDTFTALHLLTVLKSLAQRGVAVVFSLHQPRSAIYRLFDRVLLLNSVGEEAFFGPAQEALRFLEEIGIAPDYPANPADFLLDAVASLDADEAVWRSCTAPLSDDNGREASVVVEEEEAVGGAAPLFLVPPPTQGRDIAAAFRNAKLPAVRHEMAERLRRVRGEDPAGEGPHVGLFSSTPPHAKESPYFRGFACQVRVIATRCTLNKLRDPVATAVSCSVALLFAALIGSIYFRLGHTQNAIRDRMGVLFFLTMNTTFSALGSLAMFLTDRGIYAREHRNGMYSAAAYYIGKVIQDVPIGIAVNTLFNLIVYVLVGLQPTLGKFLVFDLVCSLVMLDSYAMCLFMSNLSKDYAVANVVASLVLVLFLLPTGGMLISLESIPVVWRWIKYISFVRYGFGALVMNEFDGLTFSCGATAADGSDEAAAPCVTSGTAYAASQGFYYKDLWTHVAAVSVSIPVYLLLGYWTLRIWRSAENK